MKNLSSIIGYSGHSKGIDDAIAAICLDARYVEKHFTIDQNLPGRDNMNAILPEDLLQLSSFRNNYLKMIENRGLDLQSIEKDINKN